MRNARIGTDFDDFLKEEGIQEEATAAAIKRVIAWQLAEAMKKRHITKTEMAARMILEQRPERFLRPAPGENEPPVIDYHLMRSCLRTGLVEVIDDELQSKLIGREELTAEEEWAVRLAAYQAIQRVQALSGRSMGAVDWFFFNARRRCPEMTEPDCANCAIDAVCAHRKDLLQPVRRTTFYSMRPKGPPRSKLLARTYRALDTLLDATVVLSYGSTGYTYRRSLLCEVRQHLDGQLEVCYQGHSLVSFAASEGQQLRVKKFTPAPGQEAPARTVEPINAQQPQLRLPPKPAADHPWRKPLSAKLKETKP